MLQRSLVQASGADEWGRAFLRDEARQSAFARESLGGYSPYKERPVMKDSG